MSSCLSRGLPVLLAAAAATMLLSLAPAQAARAELRCTPENLSHGGVLELAMAVPHPRELGVVTPSGRFVYLVFPPETDLPAPLLNPADFAGRERVMLKTPELRGWSATSGSAPVRVFEEPGEYRVVVGANLETEDDTGANWTCRVAFKD